jgi:ParB family chromosome partitioning protein
MGQKPESVTQNADATQLEQKLSNTLGTKVNVRHNGEGRGKLVIQYANLDQLNGILSRIK